MINTDKFINSIFQEQISVIEVVVVIGYTGIWVDVIVWLTNCTISLASMHFNIFFTYLYRYYSRALQ